MNHAVRKKGNKKERCESIDVLAGRKIGKASSNNNYKEKKNEYVISAKML